MSTAPIDALLAAIQSRWARGDGSAVTDFPLVDLGKADVERPAGLAQVLGLKRKGAVHAVLGIVVLDDVKLEGDVFGRQRDAVRRVAHYLATHLNPPSLADNAHVWAVAPSGNEDDSAWRHLRQELHQDTWSVPKSLWLPGNPPDATAFLEQGFLATPWKDEQAEQADALDLIDRFAKKLGPRNAPWQRERVLQLVETLRSGQTDPETIAASLILLAQESP